MTAFKHTVALAALLAGVAGTASAQVAYTGAVNLGYADIDGDTDATNLTTDFDANIAFNSGFELDLGLSMNRVDVDEVPFDLHMDRASIAPKYNFSNGLTAGLYVEKSELSIGEDVDMLSYGLNGEYAIAGATFGAFYGETDIDGLDDDTTDWGLNATYAMGETLAVAGGFARTEVDASGEDLDLDLWKLGAAYDFGNNITVFAGASWGDFEGMDVDTWGLGASYDASAYTPIPVIASIEYAETDADMLGDLDVWRFGVTLPFGNKGTASAPLNSVAGSAFNQSPNTISDALVTAF